MHPSSINLENFKDRALIIPEVLEFIKLHTYKFGLVYVSAIGQDIYICELFIGWKPIDHLTDICMFLAR